MAFNDIEHVRVGDLTFDVRIAGPSGGTPVFLLHGFPQTSRTWTSVAARLVTSGLCVYAPDQRGYSPGARPPEVSGYATEVLADDVIAIADALSVPNFHLVGHDWGAAIAWLTTTMHPSRIRTLTAVSIPHLAAFGAALSADEDQQHRSAYIGKFRQREVAENMLLRDHGQGLRAMYGGVIAADLEDSYVAHMTEPGALTAALNWYRAMRRDLSSTAPVRVPTTFVWSDQDPWIGRLAATTCGDFVRADYIFKELTDVSHWIPEQAPDALSESIIERVRSI